MPPTRPPDHLGGQKLTSDQVYERMRLIRRARRPHPARPDEWFPPRRSAVT